MKTIWLSITLWWTNIAMENHHAINGKIHYFYGHFPLLCDSSPEGINYHQLSMNIEQTFAEYEFL